MALTENSKHLNGKLFPFSNILYKQTKKRFISNTVQTRRLDSFEVAHQTATVSSIIRKERNVLFNDTLNTFYLRLYGIRHIMVKDHSDSEKGNLLLPQ